MEKHITTPITQKITKDLRSGDYVYITGEMYVARDAAHKRMIEALDRKEYPITFRIALPKFRPLPVCKGIRRVVAM